MTWAAGGQRLSCQGPPLWHSLPDVALPPRPDEGRPAPRRTIMTSLRSVLSRKSLIAALAASAAIATVTVSGPVGAHASTRPVAHHAVASPNPLAEPHLGQLHGLDRRAVQHPAPPARHEPPPAPVGRRPPADAVVRRVVFRQLHLHGDASLHPERDPRQAQRAGADGDLPDGPVGDPGLPDACRPPPQQRSYYRWINRAARADRPHPRRDGPAARPAVRVLRSAPLEAPAEHGVLRRSQVQLAARTPPSTSTPARPTGRR